MPGSAFDANMAVLYGRFVQAAYTMYGNSPAANATTIKRLSCGISAHGMDPNAGFRVGEPQSDILRVCGT